MTPNCYRLKINKVIGDTKIAEIISGISRFNCNNEDHFIWHPTSDFLVRLNKSGKKFGNCLYDGHWEQFYFVSQSVLDIFKKFNPNLVFYKVNLLLPLPEQLKNIEHEEYYSINYRPLSVVNLDLKRYAYKNPWICPDCNSLRSDNKELFKDILNNTVKQSPWDLKEYKGDHIFRLGATNLGCSENLKIELERNFSKSFSFEKLMF